MYEVSYGSKYEQVKEYGLTAIAKLIRADIKQAKQDGLWPAHWKYSVRTEKYAGGGSIEVTVTNCVDAWVPEDFTKCAINSGCNERTKYHHYRNCGGAEHLTEEAEGALKVLKQIHGAYNFDGSESMVDYFHVNYYGQVEFETLWTAAYKERQKVAV